LLINNFCIIFFDFYQFKRQLKAKDYFIQIIIGRKYYGYFWYMNNLLFISLLFTIISFLFNRHFLFIIQLIGLISYRLHLSSLYNNLNKKNLAESWLILLIEMIPAASIGLTFGAENLIAILKRKYVKHIIIHASFLYFLFKLNIFQLHNGYLFSAIEMNTLGSINFFCIFSIIPFEYIKKKRIIDILKYISNYTGGIYYIHVFLCYYLGKIIIYIRYQTFFGCILLYIICYFICLIGNNIFHKTFLKYLFL
jgi:hypothetical protein